MTPSPNVDTRKSLPKRGIWQRFYVEVSFVAALFIAYGIREYATHPGLYVALSTFLCDVVLFKIARLRVGVRLLWVAILNFLSLSILRVASDRIELYFAVFVFIFTCLMVFSSFTIRSKTHTG